MVDSLFVYLQNYLQNPQAMFPDKNQEQLEIFATHLATPAQTMLYYLGNSIDD